MRVTEIVVEAFTDPSIRDILEKKGYKYLDKGADQQVYLAPDGTILKIFGTNKYARKGNMRLTKGQKIFKAFADYCLEHPDNEFLPQFSDWATFEFEGKPYLQIKMERLFPFKNVGGWADVLGDLATAAASSNSAKAKEYFINDTLGSYWQDDLQELVSHLGEEGFNKLWDTIYDLRQVATKLGLSRLDLHPGNFMLTSDGQIVINDPFYTPDW